MTPAREIDEVVRRVVAQNEILPRARGLELIGLSLRRRYGDTITDLRHETYFEIQDRLDP